MEYLSLLIIFWTSLKLKNKYNISKNKELYSSFTYFKAIIVKVFLLIIIITFQFL